MQETVRRLATYQDILDLPERFIGQILDGKLVTHPRPRPRHAVAASELCADLVNGFGRGRNDHGSWRIIVEPELHLAADIVVPDLAGWRRKRMPKLPETAWFELVPDWVCEFVSPSTARHDRGTKMEIYAREGVTHVWIGDADAQTIETYALNAGRYVLLKTYAGSDEIAAPPFEAAPFSLASLWVE